MASKDGQDAAEAAREVLTGSTGYGRDVYYKHNTESRVAAAQVLATLELAEAIRSLKENP